MIYQLAKTSPLITGQVKMNMIMNGNKVVDIQYVPLSNYIPFAYNNPIDVLNYTHGENVKSLYKKISGQFFKDVQNPKLSVKQLHRYDTLRDETRDFTYEMGMKRMEYQRYNKQFEFFCPFWCDNTEDFDNLKFVINIKNVLPNNPEKERIVFSKVIEFDDKVKQYLKNIYPSLGLQGKNSEILYINFNEMQSHIKGLNVASGNVQTVDTSYAVNNLLMRERPVLETDNMLVSLFGSNKIISTQFFNFSFVFNIEDLLPINFIKSFISERINIYVDMYLEDKLITEYDNEYGEIISEEKIVTTKVDVKDLYTNYEFIPKYDIYTSKYSDNKDDDKYNVLSYLSDNKCIELINKNKLIQSTFHWVLQNNTSSIFNLYNGFSPLNNGEERCTAISNDATDMFTDIFNLDKNPFGVFKYTYYNPDETDIIEFAELLDKESTYSSFDLTEDAIRKKDYQFLGNILINNSKVIEYKKQLENISTEINYKKQYINEYNKYSSVVTYPVGGTGNKKISDYELDDMLNRLNNDNAIFNSSSSVDYIKCAVIRLNNTFNYTKLRNVLSKSYLLTGIEYMKSAQNATTKAVFENSSYNFIATQYINKTLKVIFFVTKDNDECLKNNVSFRSLYNIDFAKDLIEKQTKNSTYINYPYDDVKEVFFDETTHKITQKVLCYNALNIVASIIKCAKFPNYIVFDKSFSTQHTNSPSIISTEVEMVKSDKYSEIYRYDSNVEPMFIDIKDDIFTNNVYYCKQYNRDVSSTIKNIEINNLDDIDGIKTYSKYALDKFSPIYKSIGYYVLNSEEIDYSKYYRDVMFNNHEYKEDFYLDGCNCYCKEVTWYKNNAMLYLPESFKYTLEKSTEEPISEDDIIKIIYEKIINESEGIYSEVIDENNKKEYGYNLVKYYIKDLYLYSYIYDYVGDKIEQQKYEIKFTLK